MLFSLVAFAFLPALAVARGEWSMLLHPRQDVQADNLQVFKGAMGGAEADPVSGRRFCQMFIWIRVD